MPRRLIHVARWTSPLYFYNMKNKLHKLLIKLRLYSIIYKGHFTIGKTIVGQHFLIGEYKPISLKRCIEIERGYHQESFMEESYERSMPGKGSLGWMSGAGVGAAALLMAGCSDHNKLTSGNGTMLPVPGQGPLPTPQSIVPDPPHS